MPERITDEIWVQFLSGDFPASLSLYERNCVTICKSKETCSLKREKRNVAGCMAGRLAYVSLISPDCRLEDNLNTFNKWRAKSLRPEKI